MTDETSTARTIEVDADVYDVLATYCRQPRHRHQRGSALPDRGSDASGHWG
ncbi:hypothetical protein [Salinispora arenicola]|uniref:hypothetical protein n=1 Tax=Salinispora arenicola TaxID=168697 RepID=UPI00169D7213|nr:hypothetical protein [Salinispora arenicola]NIL64877.1 hypothetical protein [Salinispora arenicola]